MDGWLGLGMMNTKRKEDFIEFSFWMLNFHFFQPNEMKSLLFGIAALLVGLPAHSETVPVQSETIPAKSEGVFLLILAESYNSNTFSAGAIDMHSLPMQSFEQCELAGAKLISSKRLVRYGTVIGFECIEGK